MQCYTSHEGIALQEEHHAAVMAVQAEWSDAFEKRDIDRLVALYAPTLQFWGSTNALYTDQAGVRQYFMNLPTSYMRSRFEEPQILSLGPAVLSASGYVVFFRTMNGEEVELPYRMTHVLVRHAGAWKITVHHASPQFAA